MISARPRRSRPRLAALGLVIVLLTLMGARPQAAPAAVQTTTFSNTTALSIPSGPGVATPYPAEIVVSGLAGSVTKVTVTLHQLSHTFAADLDIVLVGPNGGKTLFLSDVGAGNDYTGQTLTFDDNAAATIPQGGPSFADGTYAPLNVGDGDNVGTPPPPYSATFGGAFNGSDPNGIWQLVIFDDLAGDSGSLAGGWSVTITTDTGGLPATGFSSVAGSGVFGDVATLTATLASNGTGLAGKPVAFSLNGVAACDALGTPACPVTDANGVATLAGVSLAGTPGGTYPTGVGATFAGDGTYAASSAVGPLTVNPAAQVITFTPDPLPNRTFGDAPFTVAATASSGLPVGFSATPASVCATSGADNATIVLLGAGTCTVTATQGGNASYAPAASVARPFTVTLPPVGVTVTTVGPGSVTPGTGNYPQGQLNLTATPQPGALFTGWIVDGQRIGWDPALTLTITGPRSVVATFGQPGGFRDVPGGTPVAGAIAQLTARGIVKGYGDGTFGPNDPLARAQVAALVVRALALDATPDGPPPFSDLADVDPELQRAIAILALDGIARGFGDGTFAPAAEVAHIQVISFITRAMVAEGYWTAATQDDPTIYPNVPLASGNRLDLVTFVQQAGALPDRPSGQAWADWNTAASRGWTAQVLWQALNATFATNRVP